MRERKKIALMLLLAKFVNVFSLPAIFFSSFIKVNNRLSARVLAHETIKIRKSPLNK